MAKRSKRSATPIALLWTRRDQRRFIDAVEKFVSTAADLHALVVGQLAELQALQAKQSRRRRTPAAQEQSTDNGMSL